MALIPHTEITHPFRGSVRIFKWASVTDADTCEPAIAPGHGDKTIQADGDFGSGGTVQAQGNLDPAGAAADVVLNDPQGVAIAIQADGAESIEAATYSVTPVISAGTSVDLDIFLFVRV